MLFMTYIFNAMLREEHIPLQFSTCPANCHTETNSIPLNQFYSYSPTSFLPVITKVLEKLFAKRGTSDVQVAVPDCQFGFRQKRGTVEQVHRRVRRFLGNESYCSAALRNVTQEFDNVLHPRLL